jgi:hypothetical protein
MKFTLAFLEPEAVFNLDVFTLHGFNCLFNLLLGDLVQNLESRPQKS